MGSFSGMVAALLRLHDATVALQAKPRDHEAGVAYVDAYEAWLVALDREFAGDR